MAGRFSVESVFKAVDRVTGPVTRMQARVGKFTQAMGKGLAAANRQVDKLARGLMSGAKGLAKMAAVGVGAAAGAVTLLVREFSKIEDAEAAFTPLLGGAKRAKEMVEALNQAAAATPFQFEDLAATANQLLPVMDGNIEKTIATLKMLGDTAGGNAQKLDSITRGFTKAMLKGKVDMESLNMIAEAGVPIFDDLAAVMGTKVGEKFFKSISAGKVTTEQLTKAFQKLTGEGGKFQDGMIISSRTLSGTWSTLTDNISLAAAELGGALAPVVKELIGEATAIAEKVREWAKANRGLIESKVREFAVKLRDSVLRLVEAVRRFSANYDIPELIENGLGAMGDFLDWLRENGPLLKKTAVTVLALVVALKVLAAAMLIVNIAMAANPIGLVVLGIAALVAAVAGLIIWWDEIKAAFLGMPTWIKVAASAFALLFGPVGWLISAAIFVMDNWTPLSNFFSALLTSIEARFNAFVSRIMGYIESIKGAYRSVADFAGGAIDFVTGGDDDEQAGAGQGPQPQVVSPQERVSRSIEETRNTDTAEVVIKDATGRASVPRGRLPSGVKLTKTGTF